MAKIIEPTATLEQDRGVPFSAQLGSARGGIRYIRSYSKPSKIPAAVYADLKALREISDGVWRGFDAAAREKWEDYARVYEVNPFFLFAKTDLIGSTENRIGIGKVGQMRIN